MRANHQSGSPVHRIHIKDRIPEAIRKPLYERILHTVHIILVLTADSVKTRMEIRRHRIQSLNRNRIRQNPIQLETQPDTVKRHIRIKMGNISPGIHTRISPTGSGHRRPALK